jgi:hypothetical protein
MTPPRWAGAALAACAAGLMAWWWPTEAADTADGASPRAAEASTEPNERPAQAGGALALATASPAPAPRDRSDRLALWTLRLDRARQVEGHYRQATRYPPDSRPMAEHGDQKYPNRAIEEDQPLRLPGSPVVEGLHLKTTQERVFVQGQETVLFTIAAHDGQGQALPLQVQRAFAHEGGTGVRPSSVAPVAVSFRDDGRGCDAAANDGVLSLRLQPATQGFAELSGLIRVEAALQSGDQPGFVYFDVIYSPTTPATWAGAVREAVEAGSLNLYLKAQVLEPGRYVVSGRIDDASGRPFALVSFNDELAAGAREMRLQVFGKLLRDGQPSFPLTLRDVDAFLLKPDAFPDRALMPRLPSAVHVTRSYPLSTFSDAEWRSDERDRYLAEYGKDLKEAEDQVGKLTKGGP